jgi:hypothetical protein
MTKDEILIKQAKTMELREYIENELSVLKTQ